MILPSARTIFYTKPFVWQHDVWNRSTHHHATFANFEEAGKKITCNICNMANGMVLIRDCRWLVLMMTLNFVFFFHYDFSILINLCVFFDALFIIFETSFEWFNVEVYLYVYHRTKRAIMLVNIENHSYFVWFLWPLQKKRYPNIFKLSII